MTLLYDFTVTGAGQQAIDTNVDGPLAGLFPQTFHVLEVYATFRTNNAGIATGGNVQFRVNNSATAANYDSMGLDWLANPVLAAPPGGGDNLGVIWFCRAPGAAATANFFGSARLSLNNYTDTNVFKVGQMWGGDLDRGGGVGTGFLNIATLQFRSTAAITRLALNTGNALVKLVAGSKLTVFGG